jgi:spermidine synthase
MPGKQWISETLFDELGLRMSYEVERVLHEDKTEHQDLVLFEHKFFGKMLMLDGATQITARDGTSIRR